MVRVSREEREELLNRKMEEIRRKNEALKKRHEVSGSFADFLAGGLRKKLW